MSENYILKWREGKQPERKWFLRGLKTDGSFYGEIALVGPSTRSQIDIKGTIPHREVTHLRQLIQTIQNAPKGITSKHWIGMLAEGPISNPVVLFRYAKADDEQTPASCAFLELIKLLSPLVAAQSKKISSGTGRHLRVAARTSVVAKAGGAPRIVKKSPTVSNLPISVKSVS